VFSSSPPPPLISSPMRDEVKEDPFAGSVPPYNTEFFICRAGQLRGLSQLQGQEAGLGLYNSLFWLLLFLVFDDPFSPG